MSEKWEIKIENDNIESIQIHHIEADDIKFKYSENTNANIAIRSYSKIGDDDLRKLVSEVEITKLLSLRYFDSQ